MSDQVTKQDFRHEVGGHRLEVGVGGGAVGQVLGHGLVNEHGGDHTRNLAQFSFQCSQREPRHRESADALGALATAVSGAFRA